MEINKNRECIPIGGYKVVYEYANMLAKDGYNVVIAYSHARCHNNSLYKVLYSFIGFYYRKVRKQLRGGTYFKFDEHICKKFYYRYSAPWFHLKNNDIAFATAYETACELNEINTISQDRKYYLIQDYETWADTDKNIDASYRFGMHNIAIAPWLHEKIEKAGAKATYLPNGFNFDEFQLTKPIEGRDKYHVVMLNHILDHKRCVDAWKALNIAKEQIPELHVTMFGAYEKPSDMPSWYKYFKNPSKEELNNIYNNGAIYIAASDFEGFGLTIGEAMICGCAVTCTNNGGFLCMAKDNDTALVSNIYDVEALAKNICLLVKDDKLRCQIAKRGNEYIKKFTWEASFNKLKQLL